MNGRWRRTTLRDTVIDSTDILSNVHISISWNTVHYSSVRVQRFANVIYSKEFISEDPRQAMDKGLKLAKSWFVSRKAKAISRALQILIDENASKEETT